MNDNITFSFGKNWQAFLDTASEESANVARSDIEKWLGVDAVKGKTVLDIGCGSGIHSLAFIALGTKAVIDFDADPYSVSAAQSLWSKVGEPSNWKILSGSVLDKRFLETLGKDKFDIVYSWGVLHHTGAMWEAIENASTMVKKGGLFWIALYVKGPRYKKDLKLKKRYNSASPLGKKSMRGMWIARQILYRAVFLNPLYGVPFRNPFKWNEKKERGMDTYHDIVDWLGGLPYEVASVDEVVDFTRKKGFVLERIQTAGEGGNNIYLFSNPR